MITYFKVKTRIRKEITGKKKTLLSNSQLKADFSQVIESSLIIAFSLLTSKLTFTPKKTLCIYIYIYSYIKHSKVGRGCISNWLPGFLSITSLFPFRWRFSRDFWEIQTDKVILGTKINTTKETSENVTGWVTFSLHVFSQSRVDFCSQIYLGYKQRKLTNEFGYRKVSGYTLMSFKT